MKSAGFVLFAIWLFSNCQSKYEKMQGHWHAIDSLNSSFYATIDIKDSTGVINKRSVTGFFTETFSVFELKDNLLTDNIFIANSENDTLPLQIKNDTLIFSINYKYLKHDPSSCLENDLFSEEMVRIKLKNCSENTIIPDSLEKTHLINFISIGKPKEIPGSLEKTNPDSIYIQVNDVFIIPKEFKLFIKEAKGHCYEKKFGFCLNIDKATPQQFIDSVYAHLIPYLGSSDLYHSCYNPITREVEFNKINVGNLNY